MNRELDLDLALLILRPDIDLVYLIAFKLMDPYKKFQVMIQSLYLKIDLVRVSMKIQETLNFKQ